MQDILKDIVKHTHSLGIIQAAKVTTDDEGTLIDAMAVSYTHLTLPTS